MNTYAADKIRNISLLGHHSSGKTTLTESMLYTTNAIKKPGRVESGNTVSDYSKEEKERHVSISTSVIPVEWHEHKYNILDTPGFFDFLGDVDSALRVTRGAVILVDASSGVEVGTEKAWKYTKRKNIPTLMFLNKMDKENINFDKVLEEMREKLGKRVAPFQIPIGTENDFKGFINIVDMKARIYDGQTCNDAPIPENMMDKIQPIREMLMESVAESDEELMEKYFAGEEFTEEEIHAGLRKGVIEGTIAPVLVGSTLNNVGIHTLLDMMWDYLPAPTDMKKPHGVNPETEETMERDLNEEEPFSAVVFKTVVDPYVGKISMFKVRSGKIRKDDEIYNVNRGEKERINGLYVMRGKEQLEVEEIRAGDIGAIPKLAYTQTGDTLCCKDNQIKYREIPFATPTYYMAFKPHTKNDEDKIGTALNKIHEEDPSFTIERRKETHQLLIGSQGQTQIDIIVSKLKNIYGVSVDLEEPKVAYRETIKAKADVQGKHKKQTGGAGQYGDVKMRFEHTDEEFIFEEEVYGGSVPKNYIPAVERGIRDCLEKGVLAGYPVVNLKAVLYDGSYHPVDSSEMAFRMAASIAYKKGLESAKPILLEPIMKVEVTIPDDYMGDIMGDMNRRRGRVLGMEQREDGEQLVIAEAPESEMLKYSIDLKSMTQARGSFSMAFERYEEVPPHLAEKIIEEAKEEHN